MSDPGLPKRTVSEEDLERLARQREQSDSRYDEALTTLDQTLFGLPDFPHPPPAPDETQVTPLNTRWDILRARPADRPGWRGRLARFVWGVVEPVATEQQAFNALLVDHINRNIDAQRETAKSIDTTIALLKEQLTALFTFHSMLLQYLQRITPFVNSKDYEFAALARRIHEDTNEAVHSIARTQRGLSAAVQGLSNELLKQLESVKARVQRYDGRIDAAHAAVAVVQQQAVALQRELGKVSQMAGLPSTPEAGASLRAGKAGPTTVGVGVEPATVVGPGFSPASPTSALESWKYPAFEEAFRGSQADIGDRLSRYVEIFASAGDVLDVGCGRGEFLALLRAKDVTARGIDLNYEMVELCRARGLDVSHGDVLSHLGTLSDQSLGGIFAAQVVEHLTPDYLLAFLNEAQRVLRSGAPIVLETINVASWYAFFQSYIRDITHATPLHPETLKYLVIASGFANADVEFRVPVDEADQLQRSPEIVWRPTGEDKDAIITLARTVDQNVDVLNRLMFASLDYAVIARRA
jgi:SAM-dependent methyltransferase